MTKTRALLMSAALNAAVGGTAVAVALPLWQATYDESAAIRRAFQTALNREPTPSELRRYRVLMDEYGWHEADVRRDLGQRSDYQRYSRSRSLQPDAIVTRAYQDILGRDPDAEGLRSYGSKIVTGGWTEQEVREALRSSPEYASMDRRTASADRIIHRAYQDILHREPDPSGLESYRRNIVENGWDEQDVRQALRHSSEKREQRQAVTDARATDMVRQAYLDVLHREPDATGMREYKARVMRDGWTQPQLAQALRDSDEYRNRNQ
jgi:TorA maturation chaperone TorD